MNENEIAIFDDMLLETVTEDNIVALTAPMVSITNVDANRSPAWYANQVITGNLTASDVSYTGTSSFMLKDLMSIIENMQLRIDEITESVKPVENEPAKKPNVIERAYSSAPSTHVHSLGISHQGHGHSIQTAMQQIDHAKVDADRTGIALGTSWFNTNSERQELFIREQYNLVNQYADENNYMFQKAALTAKVDMVIANPPYSIKSSHSVFDFLTKVSIEDEAINDFERAMEIVN